MHTRVCSWVGRLGAVAVVAGVAGIALGDTYNDASGGGDYNVDATWDVGPTNPGGGTADEVTIDESTVTITAQGDASNDTVTVSGSGVLKAAYPLALPFDGAAIRLAGGALNPAYSAYASTPYNLGGDVSVVSNSTIRVYNNNGNTLRINLGDLSVTNNAVSLVITNTSTQTGNDALTLGFGPAEITKDAELDLGSAGARLTVRFESLSLASGTVLTGSGTMAGKQQLHVDGSSANCAGDILWQNNGAMHANASNALGTATVRIESGTVSSDRALGFAGNTFDVYGGTLSAQTKDVLRNAQIYLRGGTLYPSHYTFVSAADGDLGGDVSVVSNSTIRVNNKSNNTVTMTLGALSVTNNAVSLVITNTSTQTGSDAARLYFGPVTITEDTEMDLGQAGTLPVRVYLDELTGRGGKTLTRTGDAGSLLTLSGDLAVELAGSAMFVPGNPWNMTTGTVTRSGLTGETSAGLFSYGNIGDGSSSDPITVTMSNLVATTFVEGRARFTAEDAGHVAVTDVAAGKAYTFVVTLANFDAGKSIADVATELSRNTDFTGVAPLGGEAVTFRYMPATSGTLFFAWDNSPGSVNDLGADVTGISAAPRGAVLIIR